jgi:hypothetical protein
MNNTYDNATLGAQIKILGTNASAFVNSINSANIYGVTANVSSSKINIIVSIPGSFNIYETDTKDTPLANAGIQSGSYDTSSGTLEDEASDALTTENNINMSTDGNLTVITGSISNPTFEMDSYFSIGSNWNAILNAMPKNQRRLLKLMYIAAPERQKVGTPSYRILNVYAGTTSPVKGHPWTT